MGLRGNGGGVTWALGLALLSLGAACEPSTGSPECGETGTYHDGGELGRHCAYIVIVGGFTCPEALPFRHDFAGGEVVCSDHETAEEDLPEEVCDAVGRDCRPPGGESCRWDKVLGGAGADWPGGMAVGDDGTVYAAVSFEGDVDFGGGVRTAFWFQDTAIVAFDGYGRYQWDRVLGAEMWELSLAADASGVIVSGSFTETIDVGGGPRTLPAPGHGVFVLALNSAGGYVWDRVFESAEPGGPWYEPVPHIVPARVAIASDGGVRLAGIFGSSTDFGGGVRTEAGERNGFVAAFDGSGAHLWDQTFGGGTSAYPIALTLGAGDDIVVGGGFAGSADFGGGIRTADSVEGFVDGFVLSLAADGSYRWDRTFTGLCPGPAACGYDVVAGTAILDDGTVMIAGAFSGGADFGAGPRALGGGMTGSFVAAYDAAGAHVWDRTYGTGGEATAMVSLGDGVAITGVFSSGIDFGGGTRTGTDGGDAFVLELTGAGAYVSDQVLSGATGTSIAVTPRNNLIVGGSFFEGPADFGHGPRTAMDSDAFVTQICR